MSASQPLARGARVRRRLSIAVVLVALALAGWIATATRMDGMDDGPGTALGGLGWFVGAWVTMMAAMMLPAVVPMAAAFDRVAGARAAAGPLWAFLSGYLLVWAAVGLLAFGVDALVRAVDPAFLAWDREGPLVTGAAVAAAGLYELTPLKLRCLRHCRTPLRFLIGHWRDGRRGAVRMGVEHGGWCVGCCWGLMLALLALGVMNVLWMVVVAAAIFAEKATPGGERTTRFVAVALVALGVWIAAAPDSAPGVTEPGTMHAMPGETRAMPGERAPGEPMRGGGMP
jgi:predicted metal-binding membrane protein